MGVDLATCSNCSCSDANAETIAVQVGTGKGDAVKPTHSIFSEDSKFSQFQNSSAQLTFVKPYY